MTHMNSFRRCSQLLLLAVFLTGLSLEGRAQSTLLYATGFEASEGYDSRFDLIGQQGWIGEGPGGSGLLFDAFPGQGQQAYIGYYQPANTNDFTTIWRPIINAGATAGSVVKFSVMLQIVASSNGATDDFRWSVYNTNGFRLVSVDFETSTGNISYVLDDGQFVFTNNKFDHDGT